MPERVGLGDLLTSLNLYSEEAVLASAETRRVLEASVRFGRPTMRAVRPGQLTGSTRMLPAADHDVLLAQFPFELQALPPYRWYESVTVSLAFTDQAVIAIDIRLLDSATEDQEDRPKVNLRGVGLAQLSWDLESAGASGLRPCSHVVQVILSAPAGVVALNGTVDARAMITRRRLGIIDRTTATAIAPEPFTLGPVEREPAMAGTLPSERSGRLKMLLGQRLDESWIELSDYVGVPPAERRRFKVGREAGELWEWMEHRGRLDELPAALRAIDRPDLAELWDHPPPVEQ